MIFGYAAFALAGLLVIFSGSIRRSADLTISGFESVGLPQTAVIPMVVLLSFGVATFMNASLHGPWWLRIVGLVFGLTIMGTWSLRDPAALGAGLLATRRSGHADRNPPGPHGPALGFDLTAQLLQQTAQLLGSLALPAVLVAGASVAEITVRATVAATRSATRLARQRGAVIILVVVLAIRAAQAVREWLERDPVSQGLVAYIPAVAIVIGFTIRRCRGHPRGTPAGGQPCGLGAERRLGPGRVPDRDRHHADAAAGPDRDRPRPDRRHSRSGRPGGRLGLRSDADRQPDRRPVPGRPWWWVASASC